MRIRDRSVSGQCAPTCLPIACTRRPTLGSLPATAHLKRGALTTALPSARAEAKSTAFTTRTRITWRTPSPLRTTSSARSRHTRPSASSNSPRSGQGVLPDETSATVSEVLVSLSTLIELKEGSTAARSIRRSSPLGTERSVRRYTSMVAMLGSIMPAPFAIPTIEPPATAARRTLG